MHEEFFELLRHKGLANGDSLADLILHRKTMAQIADLDDELYHSLSIQGRTPGVRDVAGFDFWPNSELSASFGGCDTPDCRAERLDRLARFASMWADSVQIPPCFGFVRAFTGIRARQWFLGNLRAMLSAEPAIKAGLIRVEPIPYNVCPNCQESVDPGVRRIREVLDQAKQRVHDEYVDHVNVSFVAAPGAREPGVDYMLTVRAPEDLIPHGEVSTYGTRSEIGDLTWLPRRLRERAQAGKPVAYDVPVKKNRESGVLADVVDTIVDDVIHQHLACKRHNTKYLTHRPSDVAFLNAINDNENFAAWNPILAQYLEYEMPILTGVPLTELVDLRTHDYEYFQGYRDTMKEIINNHIANRPAITGTEAKDIYDDMVRPRLHKMNQKLRAAKDKLSNKLRRDVVIAGGVVTLGLTTGIVGPELAALGATAVAGKNILEQRDASDELKSDNLYFLWKVAQKSRRN